MTTQSTSTQPQAMPTEGLSRMSRVARRVSARGEIIYNGHRFAARGLLAYARRKVWIDREGDHEINVWTVDRIAGDYAWDDAELICTAMADSAPFFLKCRFGEANQQEAWLNLDEISEAIEFNTYGGGLTVSVDCYCLENPDEANSPGFDGEKWEDLKQRLTSPEVSRTSFRVLYRLARLLRRGISLTFDGDDGAGPLSVLCANYWHPERRRFIGRKVASHA